MRRRAALLLGLAMAPRPAAAIAPCLPGQRQALLAEMRFPLVTPQGSAVTEAQWADFRAEVLDRLLPPPVAQYDATTPARRGQRRLRILSVEVPGRFDMAAPPAVPAAALAATRAWAERHGAPAEAMMRPGCLAQ